MRALADPSALLRAWDVVREREHAHGDPSPAALSFERNLARGLESISSALLEGRYRPQPLARVEIPKRAAGVRVLRIPTVRDRVVERAVHDALSVVLDPLFSPWSFAYRPGLGPDDASQALFELYREGYPWVVRCDVRDFFDHLDRKTLLRELWRHVPDRSLGRLVADLLARPARRAGRTLERSSTGAPQGSPLSPLLANLYLHRLDLALVARGIVAVRYADDIAAIAADERDARRVRTRIGSEVTKLDLELSEEKVHTASFEEGFSFVGTECTTDVAEEKPVDRLVVPDRKVLYVGRQGANVCVRNGQVRVVRARDVLLEIPISHVGQIVTFGSVGLSAGLRDRALSNQIDVVLCSRRGSYQGRLDGVRDRGVRLRRVQFRRADDGAFRCELARSLVEAKIFNQRALVLRYARRGSGAPLAGCAAHLKTAAIRARHADRLATLRGIEGAASRAYFRAWRHLVSDEVRFAGRNRRPPRDPVNAALSYGYALLVGMCAAALEAAGLDHHVGFLHDDEDGRPSLALDLMEEFRPLIVDTVVLESFRRGVLESSDFRTRDGGVLLSEPGRRRFVAAFEERMLTRFAHVPSGTRTSYRRALFLQARQVAALIRDAIPSYSPVRWR